ncbi:Ser-Thr-rich glycosyl-phosphatidyl-inositol-anchored membrane family-domain-containing protein [Hypoxylon sp. FL0543]|nr:Ser-Thr-rich glycosyl-phosphatidyl-inositol-anchored membrane family-domain-containing protein [Hypoxylon sp. FL0543]
MRSTIFASALAFAASALAQTPGFAVLTSPAEGEQVPSGKTFTIKWEAGKYTGPVVITLLGGATPTTLVPGPVLATLDVTEGSFAWNVDCSLGKEKTYGIKVTSVSDANTFQYSFPFAIAGPSCSSGAGQYPTLGSSSSSSAAGYPTSSEAASYPTSSEEASYPTSSSKAASYPTSSSSAPSYPTAPSSSSAIGYNTTVSSAPSSSSSAPVYFSTVPGNLSYSATLAPTYPATTVVTSTSAAAVTPSATSSTPSTIPTAGASNVAAGSLALIGGLAFAFLGM